MLPWMIERGSFWALQVADGLPSPCPARIDVAFREVGPAATAQLASAMGLAAPEEVAGRLRSGRRCFALWSADQIVAYGWVTRGPERVGELERTFQVAEDEAYIWDCATVARYRGQRCYSFLLSQIVARLGDEGIVRIWIGASRQNQHSIRGFENAGFSWVLDLTYRRLHRLTLLRFFQAPAAPPGLLAAAYRVILDPAERRVGPLAIGYRQLQEG